MVVLKDADLAALADIAAMVPRFADTERFGEAILAPLRRLIPADSITYNEIDTRRRHNSVAVDPPDALDGNDPAVFQRYVSQHPIVAYSRRTGNGDARTISDFVDQRQFRRTDLYANYFRPAHVEHQIAITLSYGPSFLVGVALNRAAHDFTEEERDRLNLARGQLVAGYRAARAAQEHSIVLEAMDLALEDHNRGVIIARTDGRVVFASPTAQRLLATHRGLRIGPGQQLPARLAALAASAPTRCRPIMLRGQGAILYASVMTSPDPHQRIIVVDGRTVGEPAPLVAVGLSRREHQVIELVAAGRSNSEIAEHLAVSVRTIHKHLEHIYPKLGVHDRSGAVTRWLAEQAWSSQGVVIRSYARTTQSIGDTKMGA